MFLCVLSGSGLSSRLRCSSRSCIICCGRALRAQVFSLPCSIPWKRTLLGYALLRSHPLMIQIHCGCVLLSVRSIFPIWFRTRTRSFRHLLCSLLEDGLFRLLADSVERLPEVLEVGDLQSSHHVSSVLRYHAGAIIHTSLNTCALHRHHHAPLCQ